MKKVLILLAMFALVGVGVGALWFFKVPPFGKPAKKPAAKNGQALAGTELARKSASDLLTSEAKPDFGDGRTTGEDRTNEESEPVPAVSTANTSATSASQPNTIAQRPSEPDLLRMAQVYEQMPVEEAVKIFEKLPDSLVEPLLRRMEEKQVGKLLTSFKPERSAKLTLAMTRPETHVVASSR